MKLKTKNWVSTLINILGMSIALAVFMIVMVQVRWAWTYDKNYKDSDKIVVLEEGLMSESGEYDLHFCRPLIEIAKGASPNILAVGTSMSKMADAGTISPNDNRKNEVSFSITQIDTGYLDVFPFEFVEGKRSDFRYGNIVVSESTARKLYGNEPAVGKLVWERDSEQTFEIAAVYKDFPENSSISSDVLAILGDDDLENPGEWSYYCYMRLADPSMKEETIDALVNKWMPFLGTYGDIEEAMKEFKAKLRISVLHDAYFERDLRAAQIRGNKPVTNTLFAIALLVLVLAIINFINFAFASIPFNIKEINTRKVIGASRKSLIGSQLLKAVALAIAAFILAVLIMNFAAGTSLSGNISASIKPLDNISMLLITLGIAIVSAVLAGIAPALYSTSQPTAMVLKGSYSMSSKGKALRNILVSLQFILSFVFMIFALYINVQTKYMQNKDMGFKDEQVLEFYCGWNIGKQSEAFKNALLQNPSITDVCFTESKLVAKGRMTWGRPYQGEEPFHAEVLPVSTNFLKFFGIELEEGRDFMESDNQNPYGTMIVNRKLLDNYSLLHVGSKLMGHSEDGDSEIVGVVKDFNFKPLQYAVTPIILYNWGSSGWRPLTYCYVKMAAGANPKDVIDYIKEKGCEFDPDATAGSAKIDFMDEAIKRMYHKEASFGKLISLASIVALLIALIGIIGLVFFETQFMRKEIAVRRVNGATVQGILGQINRKYLIMAGISFVVACPIAYFIISIWRKGFAYQAPIPVWIFLISLLIVLVVTALVVTLQSWRAVNANPVESLKNE